MKKTFAPNVEIKEKRNTIVISVTNDDPDDLINGLRRAASQTERTMSAQARIFIREGLKRFFGIKK